ncbi:MAG TPA: 6,7-dimethyl-8-ribityllumazine synthase [Micavibrio sp.]
MTGKILVIEARYYNHINDMLLQGAKNVLDGANVSYDIATVPGALEIPAALNFSLGSGLYDAYVVLGCIIRGETTHYDVVQNESARGVYNLVLAHDLALGNSILTVENEAQAIARAHPKNKNKGGEAAKAALAMLALKQRFKCGHPGR